LSSHASRAWSHPSKQGIGGADLGARLTYVRTRSKMVDILYRAERLASRLIVRPEEAEILSAIDIFRSHPNNRRPRRSPWSGRSLQRQSAARAARAGTWTGD
jgi:hypothetical protein